MTTSASKPALFRVVALAMAVLAGFVTVLSTGPVAANVRLTQIAPNESAFWFSVLAASGALVSAVSFVVFGRISNRLVEKFGSRQRIFIFSAIALAPLSVAIAFVDSVPSLALVWCLLQIPAAAILNTATAVVLEITPERLVGLASGLFGAAAVLAIFFGVFVGTLTNNQPTLSLVIGVTTALLLTIPAALTRENTKLSTKEPAPTGLTKAPKNFWFFVLASATSLTVSALSNDYFYQLAYRLLNQDASAAARLAQLLFATSALVFLAASFVGGLLAKQANRSIAVFFYSLLISAIGVASLILVRSSEGMFLGAILMGVGTGLNVGAQLPVMRATLPGREELGRESGIFNVATVLPGILVPAAGAIMINLNREGWPLILGASVAVLAAVGAALARTIRIR